MVGYTHIVIWNMKIYDLIHITTQGNNTMNAVKHINGCSITETGKHCKSLTIRTIAIEGTACHQNTNVNNFAWDVLYQPRNGDWARM